MAVLLRSRFRLSIALAESYRLLIVPIHEQTPQTIQIRFRREKNYETMSAFNKLATTLQYIVTILFFLLYIEIY